MGRLFLQMRDDIYENLDEEGVELSCPHAVHQAALLEARDMMSESMKTDELDLNYRIDIEDSCGAIGHTLALRQAVRIVGSEPAVGRVKTFNRLLSIR